MGRLVRCALLLTPFLVGAFGGALRADERADEDALRRLHVTARDAHRKWTRAADRVTDLGARVGDGRAAAKRVEAWEAARAAAVEWIFDTERFPVPVETVITGPKTGYGEAKQRGDAAVAAWRSLGRLLDRALKPALALSEKKAKALFEERASARAALDVALAALPPDERAAYPTPDPDPTAERLLALRCGDLAAVAGAYADLPPGWGKLCLFHAWCRTVLDGNEEHTFGMRADAVEGIREMNAYRIALGISPLVHHPELVEAARKHSEEMTRLGYFSHRSPVEGRETKEQRVALEGYGANVVECITGVGGGRSAVEFWKYDGGHHRDMTNPEVVEGGFSTRGPAVYLGGKGEGGSLPGLRY